MSPQSTRSHRLVSFLSLLLLAGYLMPATAANTTGSSEKMQYRHIPVEFNSHGETLAGQLFLPPGKGPFAAVSIIGPVAFVKEQAPLQYATRLARQGVATLIFDPRYHGASGGEPRRYESPQAKIEDLSASIDFLAQHVSIDPKRIGLIGICQGVNWAIEATVLDARVKSLALVAGHYLTPDVARMYLGDEATVQQRIDRAKLARQVFKQNGKVEYIDIVGSDQALLTHQLIEDWYRPWSNHSPWFTHRGKWENRITAMSEADIWGWRIDETLSKLTTDVVMIHADRAASGPDIPRQLFASIPATNKEMHWIEGANQLMFYESPITIDEAIVPLTQHLAKTLL